MLPDLIAFQRQFVAAIDRPATGPLAVYRNTVIHGAVEALRSNYPVVEQIVGEIHLAGHSHDAGGTLLIDSHDEPV
ncbi:MAG: putative DNA-binding domain-containing protein, partial [Pseudomonadota bacterium]